MSIIGLVGTGASIAGFWSKDVAEFQKQYFSGSFEVTAGTEVAGIFGTQYTTVFGPSIQHTVGLKLGGLAGIDTGDTFLDPILNILLGLGGNVDVVYGPRIYATYGHLLEIYRGQVITKRGRTASLSQLWSGDLAGAQPQNVAAEEMAAADLKTLRMVTLLSVLNNLTIAITDLVMHFKFPDYHRPRPENPPDGSTPDQYDKMAWDGAPRILDKVVTLLPTRLMGMIALMEKAGGLEAGWQAFKNECQWHYDKWAFVVPYFLGGCVAAGLGVVAFTLAVGITAVVGGLAGAAFAVYGVGWILYKIGQGIVNVLAWIKKHIYLIVLMLATAGVIAGGVALTLANKKK